MSQFQTNNGEQFTRVLQLEWRRIRCWYKVKTVDSTVSNEFDVEPFDKNIEIEEFLQPLCIDYFENSILMMVTCLICCYSFNTLKWINSDHVHILHFRLINLNVFICFDDNALLDKMLCPSFLSKSEILENFARNK